MNLFGIGPLEILLILVVVLIIFGPKDLQKAGRSIGSFLNKLVRSDGWRAINQTSRELRNLPNRLMRESGLEEVQKNTSKTLEQAVDGLNHSMPTTPSIQPPGSSPTQATHTRPTMPSSPTQENDKPHA